MSRNPTVSALETRKADLQKQIKELDVAIKAAREREHSKKQKALIDALAARGLLDRPLDEVLAALGGAKVPAQTPTGTPQAGD